MALIINRIQDNYGVLLNEAGKRGHTPDHLPRLSQRNLRQESTTKGVIDKPIVDITAPTYYSKQRC